MQNINNWYISANKNQNWLTLLVLKTHFPSPLFFTFCFELTHVVKFNGLQSEWCEQCPLVSILVTIQLCFQVQTVKTFNRYHTGTHSIASLIDK